MLLFVTLYTEQKSQLHVQNIYWIMLNAGCLPCTIFKSEEYKLQWNAHDFYT